MVSNGDHAHRLIAEQYGRIQDLLPQVLADREPEPLHRLRVALRRLRTLLLLFAAALDLPSGVGAGRLARIARSTGRCRDLDVLRHQLLPRLQEGRPQERFTALRDRLRRQRRRAFRRMRQVLRSRRMRRLLARLGGWLSQPRYTALGGQPLRLWSREWLLRVTSPCFLHDGWLVEDPRDPRIHALRRHIKGVRYGLEAQRQQLGPAGPVWIGQLRAAQGCLGHLHDLEVLERHLLTTDPTLGLRPDPGNPLAVIVAEREICWRRWLGLRATLLASGCRHALQQLAVIPEELTPLPVTPG